ncbi:MAG: hypothetical protein K9I94_06115 [Bacteroidales bacterium]|nr:hypothetical protein [Bacteroidales bacterium]
MKKVVFSVVLGALMSMFLIDGARAQTEAAKELPKYGEDSVKCVMNLSLYREFAKQDNYADALDPWRWVFKHCPVSSQNIYIDGTKIMDWLIAKAENDEKKQGYIDSLMMVYDQRIKYYNREGYVLGRKGVDLYKYRPNASREIHDILGRSIDLRGNESSSAALAYYFRATRDMVEKDEVEKTVLVNAFDKVMSIIEYNIENGNKASRYQNVKGYIENVFEPYSNCEDLVMIYGKKFEENPEDKELLEKITGLLEDKDCKDSDLYFNTMKKYYEITDDPTVAFELGRMLMKEEKSEKAVNYLQKGSEMKDKVKRADAYLLLAETYRKLKDFPKAREAALNATELRPKDGNPYLLIGNLYAASAEQCGDNKLTNKVAYWVAVDMYQKAKNVDPTVSDVAGDLIKSYRQQFPTAETIFFYDLNEGDSYKVDCWINRTTTVRAAP